MLKIITITSSIAILGFAVIGSFVVGYLAEIFDGSLFGVGGEYEEIP